MNLGPWEILIIAVVIVLLFGARKMPAMARSLGQSMRILKAETKGMRKDDEVEPKVEVKPDPTAPATKELPPVRADQSPEQMRQELDELQRKLAQQDQAHKNAS